MQGEPALAEQLDSIPWVLLPLSFAFLEPTTGASDCLLLQQALVSTVGQFGAGQSSCESSRMPRRTSQCALPLSQGGIAPGRATAQLVPAAAGRAGALPHGAT